MLSRLKQRKERASSLYTTTGRRSADEEDTVSSLEQMFLVLLVGDVRLPAIGRDVRLILPLGKNITIFFYFAKVNWLNINPLIIRALIAKGMTIYAPFKLPFR